jgi:hypothetical protein
MAEQLLHQRSDAALEATLRGLEPAIAWPAAAVAGGADIASSVRVVVETLPAPKLGARGGSWLTWWRPGRRPARRALVLALVALLAVAAVVGAVGLGLPGLRLIFGEAPSSPTASLAPATDRPTSPVPGTPVPEGLGGGLRLGEALDPTDPSALDERAGFHVALPADPAIGLPDAAWIDDFKGGQVTLLWAPRDDLPATLEPDIGLLMSQFRGVMDSGFFTKLITAGTVVAPIEVGEHPGYWLSGEAHVFFWEGADGFVDDPRRWVGDVLLWSDGEITYRLETSLGREEAIRIAETVR